MRRVTRADPTRTTLIQSAFVADITTRQERLKEAVVRFIKTDDELGLTTNVRRYEFLTSDKKLATFSTWLQGQIDADLLSLIGQTDPENPWTAEYVASAYRQGMIRAYVDSHKADLAADAEFYNKSQAAFLRSSFNAPEAMEKVKLLATRVFEDMKGLAAAEKNQLNRILAEGMANGEGVDAITRDMVDTIDGMSRGRASTIVRTETVRAHAEGQLDAFAAMNIEELVVMAEWSTAGDDAVCPECDDLDGIVMTIDEARGLLPRHPNCRCAWIPADPDRDQPGQVRSVDRIEAALKASLESETGEEGQAAQAASDWQGADLSIVNYPDSG